MVLLIFNLPSLAEALGCLAKEPAAAPSDGGDVDIIVPEKIGLHANITLQISNLQICPVVSLYCLIMPELVLDSGISTFRPT